MDHILGASINANVYVRPPAIVEAAKDWRYYENAIVHHEQVGAKLYLEYQESGAWKAHYKTWEDACIPLGKSRRQIDRLIKAERDIRTECPNKSPSETLATVNTLPDPMADLNPPEPQKAKGNGHMTGKAVKDTLLENGESPEDYKRTHKAPTHSGKPIYAMPAWKELEEFIGKAINRADAVNRLMPNPKAHRGLLASLKDAFTRAQSWHEEAKHA